MVVRFYANMRTVTQRAELEVSNAQVDTFRKLVDFLVERFPEAKPHLLDEDNNLRQDVPAYVDGRNPRLLSIGLDVPLKPDSIVSFFSPISSGRMNVEVLREPNFGKKE